MMLIPRRNYGLNLFDEFFNDPFFSGSTEKGNDSKKLPIMNATPVPARDPSLWENRSDRKISRLVLKTAS